MEEIDYCCISRFFPEDWEDVIKQEPAVISPFYMIKMLRKMEKEKNPHYHVILSYKGNKSFEQIDEIARLLHALFLKE